MARIIQTLRDEHKVVLKNLERLEGALTTLRKGASDAARSTLRGVAEFFRNEFKSHFVKEEDALFPPLGKVVGVEGGPIGQMLYEHKLILDTAEKFETAAGRYDEDLVPVDAVAPAAQSLSDMLKEHIYKEDECLFPMAQRGLNPGEFQRIDAKLAEIESAQDPLPGAKADRCGCCAADARPSI